MDTKVVKSQSGIMVSFFSTLYPPHISNSNYLKFEESLFVIQSLLHRKYVLSLSFSISKDKIFDSKKYRNHALKYSTYNCVLAIL